MQKQQLTVLLYICAVLTTTASGDSCAYKGEPSGSERCAGLAVCSAWNGKLGPLGASVGGCAAAEALAVLASLSLAPGGVEPDAPACRDALRALACAAVMSRFGCPGQPAAAKPCSSACAKVLTDCGADAAAGAARCGGADFAADGSCAEIPQQNQIMLAAQYGLSPIAVSKIEEWTDRDDAFLRGALNLLRSPSRCTRRPSPARAARAGWAGRSGATRRRACRSISAGRRLRSSCWSGARRAPGRSAGRSCSLRESPS